VATEADTPPATSETKPTHAPAHNESCAAGGPCAVNPRNLWAVQFAHGGIPEDPELYENEDVATRRFAELAVLNGIEFEPGEHSSGYIGNDDDEVRMWDVMVAGSAPTPAHYDGKPLSTDEAVAVGVILGALGAWDAAQKGA
jgi:hypothetical protein